VLALKEHVVRLHVLHKQHLLNDSQADSVLQVVNDIVALHATSAETPYLSLFARMRRFRNELLDEELYVKRSLIRLAAMRGTLFITLVELAPVLFQATKPSEPQLSKWMSRWELRASDVGELTAKLIDALRGGARTLPSKIHSFALLPYEDPYPKGYKVRDRLVDAEHEKKACVGGGVQPTILLDGKIVGLWSRSIERGKGRIELKFFSQPEKSVEKDVVLKAKAVAMLMATPDVDIRVKVEQ